MDSANSLLNVQSVSAAISSTSIAPGAFTVDVGGSVSDGSALVNDDNALVSAAYGTDAVNAANLTVVNVTSGGNNYEDILALANVQTIADDSTIDAQASGGTVVDTTIADVLTDSSVSTSGNAAQAVVYGNRADSSVGVEANNITANETGVNANIDIETLALAEVSASFSLNNVQAASGTYGATLLDGGTATDIRTTIGDNVANSSVASELNALSAAVTGNSAANGLSIDGNLVASSGALASYQDMIADLSATIGVDAAINEGGVTAELSGGIDASSISVSDNSTAGSVTGNSATNAVAVAGTTVSAGPVQLVSTALTDVGTGDNNVDTDYGLANVQVAESVALTSDVFGTFAIDMVNDEAITNSTIAVDGNSQSARAVANTAGNSVALSGTNVSAGSVLSSNQLGVGALTALSNLDLFAPVVSSGSSISISDNENAAVAVINNVSNTLDVAATNLDPKSGPNDADLGSDLGSGAQASAADHVLHNTQAAEGVASSTAVTTIFDDDFAGLLTTGLVDGSVAIEGNVTSAEASANRAINVANVDGSASLGASAGVSNLQANFADVDAAATTSATLAIFDDLPNPAVDASSIAMSDNSTSALARGNAATNVLNYTAGSSYGPLPIAATLAGGSIDGVGGVSSANARAAVLNTQANGGAVTATSTDATYTVALNSFPGTSGLLDASIGLNGNSIAAAAYGNTANNSVTLTALNTEIASAGIGSFQVNNGAVTASVTTVSYGINAGQGTVASSSMQVTGNQVTAAAVGNSVVSSIGVGN